MRKTPIFLFFLVRIASKVGIFTAKSLKPYHYARSKSCRRLAVGSVRQGLSDQTTSRSARPRHLCIRIQEKTLYQQKEIGKNGNSVFFPIFAPSLYLRIANNGSLTRQPRSPGAGFICPYWPFSWPVIALYTQTCIYPHKSRFRVVWRSNPSNSFQ